ncbi:putative ribonuclease H domain-containing protein [Arabidopsis thaliana]
MAGIWVRLVPLRERQSFFRMSLLEWLYANLEGTSGSRKRDWSTLFSMAVWWAWKWRCGNVFGENGKCRDRVRFIKDMAIEVTKAHNLVAGGSQTVARVERHIAWTKPPEGWVKVSTDGASRGNPGPAAAGGVIRDEDGLWVGGFALHIGVCSAPMAELWGVYYGLLIAWDQGFRRVELEVDSELVVGFLQSGISEAHPLAFLVRLCHGLLSKDC